MMNRPIVLARVGFSAAIAGCSHPADNNNMQNMQGMQMGASTQPSMPQDMSAVDLHNTVCPVSGDPVGDSTLTEVYNRKVYHFCCADCPKKFEQDPAKYANAVAADPSKYGVK